MKNSPVITKLRTLCTGMDMLYVPTFYRDLSLIARDYHGTLMLADIDGCQSLFMPIDFDKLATDRAYHLEPRNAEWFGDAAKYYAPKY